MFQNMFRKTVYVTSKCFVTHNFCNNALQVLSPFTLKLKNQQSSFFLSIKKQFFLFEIVRTEEECQSSELKKRAREIERARESESACECETLGECVRERDRVRACERERACASAHTRERAGGRGGERNRGKEKEQ